MVRRVLKELLKRKTVKRGLIVLLIGAFVAGLFAGGIVPLNIGQPPLDFNTEMIAKDFGTWTGKGALNLDQLLDSTRYITGATKESGEKVVAAAQIMKTSLSFQCVTGVRYLYFWSVGGSWNEIQSREWHPQQDSISLIGAWIVIKTDVGDLGERFGYATYAASGYLRAQFQIKLNNFGCDGGDLGWATVAQDDAYVVRGDGSIEFDRDQYQVGETATMTYAVGWSRSIKQSEGGSDLGWAYSIHSQAQGTTVQSGVIEGPNLGDGDGIATGNLYYTIQPADFVSGGCSAGSDNKLEVFLTNNLVLTKEDAATTIDQRDLGPPAPVVTVDKTMYYIGDSLTVQFTAEPNPTTNEPICGMHLRIYYELGNIELHSADFSGDAAEYTYNALPDAGLIMIEVDTWDEASRTSTFGKASITVHDPECVEGEPNCTGPINIFWIVLIMVVLAILSFVIWLPMIPLPPTAKLWISIITWGVILGMVIYFFIVPIVVEFFNSLFPFLRGG